jgi:hypothetical protein
LGSATASVGVCWQAVATTSAIRAEQTEGDELAPGAATQDRHEKWLSHLSDMVRGPRGTRVGVPRHVLERVAALIGDDAQISWVESTVRHARNEEGDGLIGTLAVFGQRLLVVATLENVQERRWPGSQDDDGAVTVRVVRRTDLERMEVPTSAGYDNGPDAWSADSDGAWRYRTSVELTYHDGTKVELGAGDSGDLFVLLPSLRDDLLA